MYQVFAADCCGVTPFPGFTSVNFAYSYVPTVDSLTYVPVCKLGDSTVLFQFWCLPALALIFLQTCVCFCEVLTCSYNVSVNAAQ
jgi:hypothetical protein